MSPRRVPARQGFMRPTLWFFLLSGFVSCFKDYYLVTDHKTFEDARACCRKKYSDVASINSADQMEEFLAVAAERGFEGELWIGRRDFGGWVWDLNGGRYFNWSEGQPDSTGVNLCAGMYQETGSWFDFNCGSMDLPFVCFDDAIDPNLTTYAAERYLYVNRTDVSPSSYCFQNYFSGLVAVRNEFENELIRQLLPPNTSIVLGLSRSYFGWWSDDSSFLYTNWMQGQPQHHRTCASSVINSTFSGQWMSQSCGQSLPFMCYSKKKTTMMIRVALQTSIVDMDDPAVGAAILTSINAKLEAGLEDKFRIYWKRMPDGGIFINERMDEG